MIQGDPQVLARRRQRRALAALFSTAAAVIASPSGVHAQTGASQVAAGGEGAGAQTKSSALSEVVVTARRRREDLQSVPVAVTAFSSEQLAERHIASQVDLANNTPSLAAIQGGYPGEYGGFVVRGQGPAYNATSGTETYFAETPDPYLGLEGRPGSYYDLANIQVLKGPQGTLFGKNSSGGSVLFEPRKPTNAFGGYVEGQLGNYSEREIDGAINVPIVDDKVLLRVAGTAERRDGYTVDVGAKYSGRDYDNLAYQGFRVGLLLRPFEGFESYSLYRYQSSDSNGAGTVPYANASTDPARVAEFTAQSNRDIRHVAYDAHEFNTAYYSQFLNQSSYSPNSDFTIKNIVSFTRNYLAYGYDYDASPIAVAGQSSPAMPTQGFDYVSEELQVQGKSLDRHLQYTAGIFGDNLHTPRDQGFNYIINANLTIPVYQRTTDRSRAAFAQGTYDFSGLSPALQGLSATAGYRYTREYTSSSTRVPFTGKFTSGSAAFHYGSYTFDVDYKVTPDVFLYASIRDAYKAGGFNTTVAPSSGYASYPPEKLVSKEVGLKATSRFIGMVSRLNLAVYSGDYENIQRQSLVVADNGAGLSIPAQVVQSAAAGKINGVELEELLVPFDGLRLTFNYAYTDSKYTKILPTAIALSKGTPFPLLPRNKGSILVAYDIPIRDEYGALTLYGSLSMQSRQSVATSNTAPFPYLPGYHQLNLRLDWDHIFGKPVGAALYVTNATDEEYATGQLDFYAANGFVTRTYAAPRMVGVQLRYSFGGER